MLVGILNFSRLSDSVVVSWSSSRENIGLAGAGAGV